MRFEQKKKSIVVFSATALSAIMSLLLLMLDGSFPFVQSPADQRSLPFAPLQHFSATISLLVRITALPTPFMKRKRICNHCRTGTCSSTHIFKHTSCLSHVLSITINLYFLFLSLSPQLHGLDEVVMATSAGAHVWCHR